MTGSLRFAGILIVSVWLGAIVFFLAGVEPGVRSQDVESLLGARNHPYYSGAIARILSDRLFYFELACAAAAIVQVVAGWLYLGRTPRKFWLWLLGSVTLAVILQGGWLEPRLKQTHLAAYAVNLPPTVRENAARSARLWQRADVLVHLLVAAGLTAYLFRVANPADPTRFVSASKFRC